jgi:hypothetical protein
VVLWPTQRSQHACSYLAARTCFFRSRRIIKMVRNTSFLPAYAEICTSFHEYASDLRLSRSFEYPPKVSVCLPFLTPTTLKHVSSFLGTTITHTRDAFSFHRSSRNRWLFPLLEVIDVPKWNRVLEQVSWLFPEKNR